MHSQPVFSETGYVSAGSTGALAALPKTIGWPEDAHLPVWNTCNVMHGEPVLLVKDSEDGSLSASLLFPPSRLLCLRQATGGTLSAEGLSINGATLWAPAGSTFPFLAKEDLFPESPSTRAIEGHIDGKRLIHFSEGSYFHNLQLCVDYETDSEWTGPTPSSQFGNLPQLRARLDTQLPISVVLLGDSISEGANASGVTGAPPFQPAYGDLFVQRLRAASGASIALHNLSKGCMRSDWGADQASAVIRCMPQLVIVAFGMNDASDGTPPAGFRKNIIRLLQSVRAEVPCVEFVLISGMSPNPAWIHYKADIRQQMHDILCCLAEPGIAVCDVRSVWDEMVRRKGFLSLTGNGANHPNDFGHRVYADCLCRSVLSI